MLKENVKIIFDKNHDIGLTEYWTLCSVLINFQNDNIWQAFYKDRILPHLIYFTDGEQRRPRLRLFDTPMPYLFNFLLDDRQLEIN